AAVAGTGLAFGGGRVLRTLGTGLDRRDLGPSMGLPRLDEVNIDGSVFVFAVSVAVLTGAVFGFAPAVRGPAHRVAAAVRAAAGAPRAAHFFSRSSKAERGSR